MRIPARCNKRVCQTRRNLSKWPEEYIRGWPKCNVAGCEGKLYVDKYRLRKGEKDHPPICRDDCYPHIHRVDSPNCKQREEYQLERSVIGSKHCPVKPEEDDEPPF